MDPINHINLFVVKTMGPLLGPVLGYRLLLLQQMNKCGFVNHQGIVFWIFNITLKIVSLGICNLKK